MDHQFASSVSSPVAMLRAVFNFKNRLATVPRNAKHQTMSPCSDPGHKMEPRDSAPEQSSSYRTDTTHRNENRQDGP